MPQLDGLRACAVLAVMAYHFVPAARLNDWAILGVKLFFVLSGFLITGILLRSRDEAESLGASRVVTLRRFYIRRFLRIFPLYYSVIAAALIFNWEPVREILPWLLTYTLNIHMAAQGWFVDKFAHFWTLAVEEQFYIFWPWLILFAPRKWLAPLTAAFIVLGPLYRAYEMFIGLRGLASFIFTAACLDALCMGALLAMAAHRQENSETIKKWLNRIALPAGPAFTAFFMIYQRPGIYQTLRTVFFDLAMAVFFAWLIFSAANGFKGIAGKFLEWGPVTYLGKISYGLYVYHPFMPHLWEFIFKKFGLPYVRDGWPSLLLSSVSTLLVASLSWRFMEKPLNDLKRYFNYNAKPAGVRP